MVYVERVFQEEMDKLEDWLPGIEEFLSKVLANELLSHAAEQQRLYFLERIDIIKLPPSIPPSSALLEAGCKSAKSTSTSSLYLDSEQEDFAAYQRELSRAQQSSALAVSTETTADATEIKVYDDIEILDNSNNDPIKSKSAHEEEESMYEIPQLLRAACDVGNADNTVESSLASEKAVVPIERPSTPGHMPPPLPPRVRDRSFTSDTASRSSIGSLLEENTTDLIGVTTNVTPDLRSDTSQDFLIDDDQESCDSLDSGLRESHVHFKDLPQLPMKRKHGILQRKLGKSLSSLVEVMQPFSSLEDIVISGELQYRHKLIWTRNIAALTNGRLVCYKLDKTDSRPSLVILLTGYQAKLCQRQGHRSFEIHLEHDNFESHVFLVNFQEWAETWCEHINAAAEGRRAPGPVQHLARVSMTNDSEREFRLSRGNLKNASSISSLASRDSFEPGLVKARRLDQSGTKMDIIGTIAQKATHLFESIGRKSPIIKDINANRQSVSLVTDNDKRAPSLQKLQLTLLPQTSLTDSADRKSPLPKSPLTSSCFTSSPLTPTTLTSSTPSPLSPSSLTHISLTRSPLTPSPLTKEFAQESPLEVKRHIKHQGYLDIYSSFNKRKWGTRWCLIRENGFECYRTQSSEVCEMEFPLGSCVLRRAIEETKSEMGLMLVENNQEKITVKPMNWTELGSWLRVLMQVTITKTIPSGLEAYMHDTNPYHEAIEIASLSDPNASLSDPNELSSLTKEELFHSKSEDSIGSHSNSCSHSNSYSNRDNGICSSESGDSKLSSTEGKSIEITPEVPCLDSSSLPSVCEIDSGAIYSQVSKASVSCSPGASSKDETNNKCAKNSVEADSQLTSTIDINITSPTKRDETKFDFENTGICPDPKRSESLVDEVMAQFKYQHDSNSDCENRCHISLNVQDSSDIGNVEDIENEKGHHFGVSAFEHSVSPTKYSLDVNISSCNIKDFHCANFCDNVDKQIEVDKTVKQSKHVCANVLLFGKHDDQIDEQHEGLCDESIRNTDLKIENVSMQAFDQHSENVLTVNSGKELGDSVEDVNMSMQAGNNCKTHETLADHRTQLAQLEDDRVNF